MRSKSLLFTGIALLLAGILIKKLLLLNALGLALIIVGVACKTTYIVTKARYGEYKPGGELVILAIGLILFFSGLYFKTTPEAPVQPAYLMGTGIALKVVFIIKFIQNVKRIRLEKLAMG